MATIGKITPELKTLIAKSARDEVRNTSNDDTYYAYIAYTDSEDYPFHDSDLSENVTDSDLIHVYKNIATMHRVLPGGVSRVCLLYTSPSPRDPKTSRMPSSA